jgi:hypothetical protein
LVFGKNLEVLVSIMWQHEYEDEEIMQGFHEEQEGLAEEWLARQEPMDDAEAWLAAQDVPDWTV